MKKKEQKEKQVNVDYEIEQKRNSNKRLMAYAKASAELKQKQRLDKMSKRKDWVQEEINLGRNMKKSLFWQKKLPEASERIKKAG